MSRINLQKEENEDAKLMSLTPGKHSEQNKLTKKREANRMLNATPLPRNKRTEKRDRSEHVL